MKLSLKPLALIASLPFTSSTFAEIKSFQLVQGTY